MRTYWHVASYRNWPSIRDNGLRPGADGHVWLFADPGQAVHFSDAWSGGAWRESIPPEQWRVPPCIVVVRTDRAVPTEAGVPGAYWVEGPVSKTEIYDVIRPTDLQFYEPDRRRFTESVLVEAAEDHDTDVMICLRPSEALRKVFADMDECTQPVDDLHITLYYLGETEEDCGGEMGRERLFRGVYDFSIHSGYRGLTGNINGWGQFLNLDENALIALWDIPGIAEFRTRLIDYCKAHGFQPRQDNHGFTPHMTIAINDEPATTFPVLPDGNPEKEIFGSVWIVWGEDWQEIQLP